MWSVQCLDDMSSREKSASLSLLCNLYDAVEQNNLSDNSVEKLITEKYLAKDEKLMHLCIVRKLFLENVTTDHLPMELDQHKAVVNSKRPEGIPVGNTAKTDLCLKLMNNEKFLSNLIPCLMCADQSVCFTASRALVAVLGRSQLGRYHDCSVLEPVLNDVLNMVNKTNATKTGSLYCLQLFTNLLKHLRKPLSPNHPILLCSISAFMLHWPRILEIFQSLSVTPLEVLTTPTLSTDPGEPQDLIINDKQFGLNLGEFLSLTVELLRYTELGLKGQFINMVLVQVYFKVIESLPILTSLVSRCHSNQMYLLKRLLDVLLKINYFSLQCSSDFELFKSILPQRSLPRPLIATPHPINVTQLQSVRPHIASQSDQTPVDSHSTAPIIKSPLVAQVTHEPKTSTAYTQSHSSSLLQPHADFSSQEKMIFKALVSLLGNVTFVGCCQFWLTKFTRVAGVDESISDNKPLIVDGLKCTNTRKACLLLLEHVAATVVKESKPHLSVKLLLHLESLLNTVVSWAVKSVPSSLLSTLEGLLQDDVDSPGVDFLRLLFYSLLTEQDDCLVRALIACTHVHTSLSEEYDDIPVETPLLHLALGVFNVHTLFVKFVSGAGFDSALLLDFVISPETNFSHFLFKYLEIVIKEKENSIVFNYDLQSACAEMDIVDEYMSLDLSGSEDAEGENHTETENSEFDLVRNNPVQVGLQLPNVQTLTDSSKKLTNFADIDDPVSTADSSVPTIFPLESNETNFNPASSRKRDSDSGTVDDLPCAKRASLSVFSESSTTCTDLQLTEKFDSSCTLPTLSHSVEQFASSKPSNSVESKESSTLTIEPNNLPSESEDLPPTATLIKMLDCLVELGDTLSRLCEKELLSKKVNKVDQIVRQTEQLKQVFSNVLCP